MEVRLFCWLYVYSGMRERACWSYLRCYGCADVVTHRLTDSCPKSGSDWKSYYGTEFSANSVAKQDADIEPNIESDGSTNTSSHASHSFTHISSHAASSCDQKEANRSSPTPTMQYGLRGRSLFEMCADPKLWRFSDKHRKILEWTGLHLGY